MWKRWLEYAKFEKNNLIIIFYGREVLKKKLKPKTLMQEINNPRSSYPLKPYKISLTLHPHDLSSTLSPKP
jgi:hypothetical protein